MRVAALLDSTPGPGFALLFGSWGENAAAISEVSPVPLMLVNPPAGVTADDRISIILAGDVLPLSSGRARAAALDPALRIPLGAQASAVRARGRIMGPATVSPLVGMREIARDEEGWVAENDAPASAPITLTARPR